SQLLPLVYDELHKLAARKLAHEPPGQTLQTTALVHEAYLRLVGEEEESHWESRGHFFAACAEAMRRILVDNARRRQCQKHGGGWRRGALDPGRAAARATSGARRPREGALTGLAAATPQAARLVQLRYFAGLSIPEAAQALGVAPPSADRLWAYARAWLHQEI